MEFAVDLFGPKSRPDVQMWHNFWGQAAGGGWIYQQMWLEIGLRKNFFLFDICSTHLKTLIRYESIF